MTSVVQVAPPEVGAVFPMPVSSKSKGTAFLVMERCADGYGIVVRRSKRYGRKLNRFWPVWARERLLKLDAKYIERIKVEDDSVRFTSERPLDDWIWKAWVVLADIVPLGEPPMRPHYWRGRIFSGYWRVHPHADLTSIISKIKLPETVSQYFSVSGGSYGVYLDQYGIEREKCPPIREVRLMVELEVARLCLDGVPLDLEEIGRRHRLAQRREWLRQHESEPEEPEKRPKKRSVVDVQLPPASRVRRRTIRGIPVVRDNP